MTLGVLVHSHSGTQMVRSPIFHLTSCHPQVSLPVPVAEATPAANKNTVAKASFLTTFFPSQLKEEELMMGCYQARAGAQWRLTIKADPSQPRKN
jgi:hypothetical protein